MHALTHNIKCHILSSFLQFAPDTLRRLFNNSFIIIIFNAFTYSDLES